MRFKENRIESVIEEAPDGSQKNQPKEKTPTDYVGMVNLVMAELLAKQRKKPNSLKISQDIKRIQLQSNVYAIGAYLQRHNEMHGHREKCELDPN